MEIKSHARFVKVAPDKIRILDQLVKDKTTDFAISQLQFANKVGAKPLILVLKQLNQQIKDKDGSKEKFKVKSVQVNEGPKLKRRRIVHQGRSTMILKRMSHITIVVSDGEVNKVSKVNKENQDIKKVEEVKITAKKTERKHNGSKS